VFKNFIQRKFEHVAEVSHKNQILLLLDYQMIN